MGVIVPAGQGDLVLDYHSTYFFAAAWATVASSLACIALLLFSWRQKIKANQ